ncbi:MAG: hypothetical protein PVSMB8_07340 [Vulcanimicrobiaceae bacterium]
MIDTIFVPRGAEADAVHRAAARTKSPVRVVTTGIGPHAAGLAVAEALAGPTIGRALITGLCGLLSPALRVGEPLVYGEIVADRAAVPVFLNPELAADIASRIVGVQSGVRAVAVDDVVTQARAKAELGARFDA